MACGLKVSTTLPAPLRSFEVSGGLDDLRGGEGLVHERDHLIEILRGALRC
jgi:hypothetical protein